MSVRLEREEPLALLVLDRPERLNALDTGSLRTLLAAIRELAADERIRVVILTGAGDRAFAAGADIGEMVEKSPAEALAFAELGQAVCRAIEEAPQPYIAAVNGYALGGGCELALACDIRLASERAVFAQPEVTLGIPPGWGGSQRLPRVVPPGIAGELLYTGRRVGAQEALRIGLVNAVYPAEELLERARELARQIAANGPIAVRLTKAAVRFGLEHGLEAGLAYERQLFAHAFTTGDQREGMRAFLEKRRPTFLGR
ncbi:MAG: enoyl-CoA hydratase-related protein [Thermomicrobium sp.]|nr:enoyl-CoA hydratase-related protein [Thermomicrobium sp.]MDW8059838.1 enoyl-CoA hydratase-related protein [Thermomicrobium sp.]